MREELHSLDSATCPSQNLIQSRCIWPPPGFCTFWICFLKDISWIRKSNCIRTRWGLEVPGLAFALFKWRLLYFSRRHLGLWRHSQDPQEGTEQPVHPNYHYHQHLDRQHPHHQHRKVSKQEKNCIGPTLRKKLSALNLELSHQGCPSEWASLNLDQC